ncbi:hypothetical protein DL766_002824 [Monosporascus sp. MC13-8B]|uniref:DUF3074 domain-containing protein n=1 Tax=Monosporascus cannonballus TaxID=155416 RepID=A0ABY0H1T6_9PEZI|nr:hypothetical protein DL762_006492 [Monosporascus cannonballus]RYO88189.1 hypothetical protein DL763_006094 [Monosporascus cannonballus]RYP34834.1 hypothetical protein DL766_002824 [Monosporascus sp. MC13-8B]
MSTASSELGPLLHLWGISRRQLPPPTASAEELAPLLTAILREAVPFIDSAAPKKDKNGDELWKPKGSKSHRDSEARINVSERRIPAAELRRPHPDRSDSSQQQQRRRRPGQERDEIWFCRRSVHADEARPGTASWAEFESRLRLPERNAEAELAFDPGVVAAREAVAWDCGDPKVRDGDGDGGCWWGGFRLALYEMRHRLGVGLRDRVFPVLQMSCAAVGEQGESGREEDEFLFVNIPVPDFGGGNGRGEDGDGDVVVGVYVAVGRIRRMRHDDGTGTGAVEWLMATAGDARGVLPAWLQNRAMPAVIWKDVPRFLAWVAREREKGEGAGVADKGPNAEAGGKAGGKAEE